ncbi:hypothetical protein HU200_032937 [Digitaria exilis]|uniref:Myb/SANT-like domain-containing protein n=1 Tax=Digitaria exilis TaxID=1010633 RepID=A0A835BMJ1_9POAL|nr:hypothetical protein HU200_032937 [Digitaria exilis]
MSKVKGKGKVDADGPPRERTITWDEEHTKFMLDWYIEYKKNQHAGFVFKKPHHMKCADALNKQFGMGVTVAQVDRHYRDYKEHWGIVTKALSKSGNSFDHVKCKITISESEKSELNDRARRLLAKPIKFYHEMEELFSGSSADGSLAMDQETCLDNDGTSSYNSDLQWMNDTSSYGQAVDLAGDDSDTLPTTKGHKPSPRCAASGDDSSSTKPHAGKKRFRGKSPKKPQKSRSRFAEATKEISNTMKAIVQALAEPPPPPPLPTPQPGGAHASLWKRIEALPITSEDKINLGVYLARPEHEGMRDFLSASSDNTLETWVYKFFSQDGQ